MGVRGIRGLLVPDASRQEAEANCKNKTDMSYNARCSCSGAPRAIAVCLRDSDAHVSQELVVLSGDAERPFLDCLHLWSPRWSRVGFIGIFERLRIRRQVLFRHHAQVVTETQIARARVRQKAKFLAPLHIQPQTPNRYGPSYWSLGLLQRPQDLYRE